MFMNTNGFDFNATDYIIILTNYLTGRQHSHTAVFKNYISMCRNLDSVLDSLHTDLMEKGEMRFCQHLTNVHVFESGSKELAYLIDKDNEDFPF